MMLQKRIMPVIILGIFWGIIGLSMVTGIWEAKLQSEDVVVEVPADIKGWMTLEDIGSYFNIPVEQVKEILKLPADIDAHTKIKDVAAEQEKETDDYREILNEYLGIPVESDQASSGGGTSTPADTADSAAKPAASGTGTSTSTSTSTESSTSTGTSPGSTSKDAGTAEQSEPEHTPSQEQPKDGSGSEETIKGRMTLSEVEYLTKVPVSYICSKLGIPENVSRSVSLRDLAGEYGFSVDDVRTIVEEYK